jgi:hypothetical protein
MDTSKGAAQMDTLEKRGADFEAKFAHDETLRFKAQANRNHALGLWAAHKLGKTGQNAEAYATQLQKLGVVAKEEKEIFQRIRADFDAANVAQSDHQIHRTMGELMDQALTDTLRRGE